MIGASLAKATLAPKSRRPRATRAGIERPGVEILAREFEPVSSARRSGSAPRARGGPSPLSTRRRLSLGASFACASRVTRSVAPQALAEPARLARNKNRRGQGRPGRQRIASRSTSSRQSRAGRGRLAMRHSRVHSYQRPTLGRLGPAGPLVVRHVTSGFRLVGRRCDLRRVLGLLNGVKALLFVLRRQLRKLRLFTNYGDEIGDMVDYQPAVRSENWAGPVRVIWASRLSRPMPRAAPSAAATARCGNERSAVTAAFPVATATPPFSKERNPSTRWLGNSLRLVRGALAVA